QHSSGVVPLSSVSAADGSRGAHNFNTVDYGPLLRAELMNLDGWVANGVEPPPSKVARVKDGTAAAPEHVLPGLSSLPGITLPDPKLLPRMHELDYGKGGSEGVPAYPPKSGDVYGRFVSAVDGDGNEVAGIRLPEISVPLATYTGWNPRHAE